MIIRPCTREDFLEFYGKEPPWTLRALCAEQDGKILGIGGYYLVNGAAFVFTNQRGMTKRQMVRAGRAMMQYLAQLSVPLVAKCGDEGDTAMKHFGFEPWGQFYRYTK